jgi:transposase-like protein
MTREKEFNAAEAAMQMILEHGTEGMAEAFRIILNEAMRIERSQAIGAEHYERTPDRLGYSNGYKPKTVSTRLGQIRLDIPQVRSDTIDFYPSVFERGLRSERALKLAIAEMYIQGVSTRKVTEVMKKLCGLEVTSTEVSRAAKMLDEHISKWLDRPLGEIRYLLLDARYEKVRVGGHVTSCSVLISVGITVEGHREILGVSVSLSEAEVHWREFLAGLQQRGLHGVQMITSDDHAGLRAALAARFAGTPWQRCQFHLQQNAAAYVPRQSMRKAVAGDLRSVFDAGDADDAMRRLEIIVEKYRKNAPRLSDWLEENVPESLTVFQLPAEHRRRLRTTNMLELLNKEVRRRTRVATLFPNEAALLRLVAAVLMETNDDWQTQHRYLTIHPKKEAA